MTQKVDFVSANSVFGVQHDDGNLLLQITSQNILKATIYF
jgi:hypothetical protein